MNSLAARPQTVRECGAPRRGAARSRALSGGGSLRPAARRPPRPPPPPPSRPPPSQLTTRHHAPPPFPPGPPDRAPLGEFVWRVARGARFFFHPPRSPRPPALAPRSPPPLPARPRAAHGGQGRQCCSWNGEREGGDGEVSVQSAQNRRPPPSSPLPPRPTAPASSPCAPRTAPSSSAWPPTLVRGGGMRGWGGGRRERGGGGARTAARPVSRVGSLPAPVGRTPPSRFSSSSRPPPLFSPSRLRQVHLHAPHDRRVWRLPQASCG